MTTSVAQLGFNLGRPLETILVTTGSAIAGTILEGPLGGISAVVTGYYIINKRWENAEDLAHKKRLEIIEDEKKKAVIKAAIEKKKAVIKAAIETKKIAEKTSWLSCRLIAYSGIVVGSIISYCNFDINKKSFCSIDANSFDCSKYSCLNAISIISALTFSVIGMFDYYTKK